MQCVPEYSNAEFYGRATITKTFTVECSVQEAENIKTVLAVGCSVLPGGEEIVAGGVNVSGRAAFYLAYEDNDGKLKKTECGAEFSVKAESDVKIEKVAFIAYYQGESIVTDAENGQKKIETEITVRLECVTVNRQRTLLKGEGLLCKNDKAPFCTIVGFGETREAIEEEFRVNYRVSDVLMRTECACISEVQCGVGSVIVDGNIFLRLLNLQNGEKNAIIAEERKIPFRTEVEIEGVTPDMTATAAAPFVRSSLKAVVDEDKNYTDFTFNFDIIIKAMACTVSEREFVSDAYSPVNEVEIAKQNFDSCVFNGTFGVTEKVFAGTGFAPQSDEELITVTGERVENVTLADDGTVSGILSAYAITKSQNGYYQVPVNGAFSFPLATEKGVNQADICLMCTTIESFSYRLRAEVELEATLSLGFVKCSCQSVNTVVGVTVGEEKQAETSAISVYVARRGDTAWDVCKQLGESEETINKFNTGLVYPLNGDERIIVYRGL